MQIDTGLFDHMVLQRDRRGASDQPITGTTRATGDVTARVRDSRGKAVRGLDGAKIGKASRGKVEARLRGVPVGGPYEIELSIGDETQFVRDVLVGDVWIAAGQSNMQGCGPRPEACRPHKSVRAFFMDDRWDVACDPIHNMWGCVDQVHIDLVGGVRPIVDKLRGVGPAVAFGQEMHRLSGGVPQGVLACAHGGTSMSQWNPALKPGGGKSLYGATIRRIRKNGGRVAGMVWYQGESDAFPEQSAHYTMKMKKMVKAFRRDTGDARLPVAIVQLSRVISNWPPREWNSIQEQQRKLPDVIDRLAVVPAIDLALSDTIHVGGRDQQRLGKRLAREMFALVSGKGQSRPITFRGVGLDPKTRDGLVNLVVKFDGVVGKLKSGGNRPVGFSLRNANDFEYIYDVSLDTNTALCRTSATPSDLSAVTFAYGRGVDPVCNITDEADRALPVFGPVNVIDRRALSAFVQTMEVSAPQPTTAKKLKGLRYPRGANWPPLERRTWASEFAEVRTDFAKHAKQEMIVFYRFTINLAERMKLSALIGYDGPIKVWVDGKEKYYDPNGTNPALKDSVKVNLPGSKGKHEIVIALASNAGLAWGVFVRFERRDVSRKQLNEQPMTYAMPELVG